MARTVTPSDRRVTTGGRGWRPTDRPRAISRDDRRGARSNGRKMNGMNLSRRAIVVMAMRSFVRRVTPALVDADDADDRSIGRRRA